MNPKLSIVIPCYNMGAFVKDAVDSVLNYPDISNIEIIIVNDGSNDDGFTLGVLDGINSPHVQVIHQENKGLGNARNTGIGSARSPYVIPLDADNMIRHEYIDKGIAILDKNPKACMAYSDNHHFGEINKDATIGPFDASKIIVKNYIDACVVLRKSAWESIDGYDEKMPVMGYEDWDLNLRLYLGGWQFEYINEVLFDYRVRENSMLVNSNDNKEILLDYMFSKPALGQAKLIRDKLVQLNSLTDEFSNMKKRKMIKMALNLEKPIKKFLNIFK